MLHVVGGEALVSIVIGNFLHAMATASSDSDVEHSIDSRLELFKLCGTTTVFDVVGHSYRLHQATRFDCMYERTGEMRFLLYAIQNMNSSVKMVLFGSYINIVCYHLINDLL
jgi:threonine dehydrogenase-like Zn-dependent dehydrogenase